MDADVVNRQVWCGIEALGLWARSAGLGRFEPKFRGGSSGDGREQDDGGSLARSFRATVQGNFAPEKREAPLHQRRCCLLSSCTRQRPICCPFACISRYPYLLHSARCATHPAPSTRSAREHRPPQQIAIGAWRKAKLDKSAPSHLTTLWSSTTAFFCQARQHGNSAFWGRTVTQSHLQQSTSLGHWQGQSRRWTFLASPSDLLGHERGSGRLSGLRRSVGALDWCIASHNHEALLLARTLSSALRPPSSAICLVLLCSTAPPPLLLPIALSEPCADRRLPAVTHPL